MRIGYSNDDEDFPGQFGIWQANCRRSVAGVRGQAALRELEAALVAMPHKRLIADAVACDGEVCAVGALLLALKVKGGEAPEEAARDLETLNTEDTDTAAAAYGVPRLVAWKLVELNDITIDVSVSHEERYTRVLLWVREQLTS